MMVLVPTSVVTIIIVLLVLPIDAVCVVESRSRYLSSDPCRSTSTQRVTVFPIYTALLWNFSETSSIGITTAPRPVRAGVFTALLLLLLLKAEIGETRLESTLTEDNAFLSLIEMAFSIGRFTAISVTLSKLHPLPARFFLYRAQRLVVFDIVWFVTFCEIVNLHCRAKRREASSLQLPY